MPDEVFSTEFPSLFPKHLAELRASAIADDVILHRGYRSILAASQLEQYGLSKAQRRVPGLLVPMFAPDGSGAGCQYKPDRPRITSKGKPVKYETPTGAAVRIDMPPACRQDAGNPNMALFVTEGVKKCDSLASAGACAVGFMGVWGFKGRNIFGASVTSADLDGIAWRSPSGGRPVYICFDSDIIVKKGVRDAMDRLAEHLRRRGGVVHVVPLPSGPNGEKVGVDDYLASGHTLDDLYTLAVPLGEYQPATKAPQTGQFPLTDLGNAERLVQKYGKLLRYCYERRKWLVWDGKCWRWDSGARVMAAAKQTIRAIYEEAANEPGDNKRKALVDHAVASEREPRLAAMVTLAQSEKGIPVTMGELDRDPWLFNATNGTVELKTGKLRAHRIEDMLTVVAPVEHNASAQCPRWKQFLNEVTNGNTELQKYLQRATGYSLTGDTREQVLFFLYGLGLNGKSTFLSVLRRLLGDYGTKANTTLFMARDRDSGGAREDLANLAGKRFVVASEVEDGSRLAVVLVKEMTGGERIRASRKYEHETEFAPEFKVWLSGNHRPVVMDTTLSIWRRLKLIPFMTTIPESKVDTELPRKLEAELSGILNWAVEGCLEWQQHGLGEPAIVQGATATYRAEQDILSEFIEDCCDLKITAEIEKKTLRLRYEQWCEETNSVPIKQWTFRDRLLERGVVDARVGKARLWRGIGLKIDDDKSDICDAILPTFFHTRAREESLPQNVSQMSLLSPDDGDFPDEWATFTDGDDKEAPEDSAKILKCEAETSIHIKNAEPSDGDDAEANTAHHAGVGRKSSKLKDGDNTENSDIDVRGKLDFKISAALDIWRFAGSPAIPLIQGEVCTDLAKLLNQPFVEERRLAAVNAWLHQHSNGGND